MLGSKFEIILVVYIGILSSPGPPIDWNETLKKITTWRDRVSFDTDTLPICLKNKQSVFYSNISCMRTKFTISEFETLFKYPWDNYRRKEEDMQLWKLI